jgi:L-asparaginase II
MTESILAVVERSGLVEEIHTGAVFVFDPRGNPVAAFGDVDRPFFIRSSAKPFQAFASLSSGLELPDVHLALACSSHSGDPVHVAVVEDILARHGLNEDHLRCPSARPSTDADRGWAARGVLAPARRFHNCSGKHAAMLAACISAGWDTDTYLDPHHPLQRRVEAVMADVTGEPVGPPGVDGCGLPVWRVTTRGLARAFWRLATEARFERIRTTMGRYPMLVSGEGRCDGLIGRWTGAAAKGGAAGCMGVAFGGYGIGVKAWSGSGPATGIGAVRALDEIGALPSGLRTALEDVARPPVLGGGKEVGRFRPAALLESL